MISKVWTILILVLVCMINVNAVTIVENQPGQVTNNKQGQEQSAFTNFMSGISMSLIVGAIAFAVILGLLFAIVGILYEKFQSYIRAEVRKRKDLEFNIYYTFHKICKRNADKSMRKSVWWTLWLWTKRTNVFLETEKGGRKHIGKYDGHAWKKEGEGWFTVALNNFMGLKNTFNEILVMPKELADEIVYFDDVTRSKKDLIIRAEGIDETSSTEYFLMPLVKDKEGKFMDFSDLVQKQLLSMYTHRKVIKEITEEYRESIRDSVEMNPYIQSERKAGSKLRE